MSRNWTLMLLAALAAFFMAGCASALPLRSDMPLFGYQSVGLYELNGPASDENRQKNEFVIRGVNEYSPMEWQKTQFGKIPGVKTQKVDVHGQEVLGMNKVKREFGYTGFSSVETASYQIQDAQGQILCGLRVRVQFNRNFAQYFTDRNDYDAIFVYDVPCSSSINATSGVTATHQISDVIPVVSEAVTQVGAMPKLDIANAKLRALIFNEVWQFRIAGDSSFFNMGHSVTIIGGIPSQLQPGWWQHGDIPNSDQDSIAVVNMLNDLVTDISSSDSPWLEFRRGGPLALSGAYVIYSAGDADQYATFNRQLLNRQNEYVVFYRPDIETTWDFITVKPVYDFEWNNVKARMANVLGFTVSNPFKGRLNEQGLPKTDNDPVVTEIQKSGWQNAPNATLNQIQYLDRHGKILYAMTIRAYVGASDSLIMFGGNPGSFNTLDSKVSFDPANLPPRPILYDEKGNVLSEDQQKFKSDEDWIEFNREATIWNFISDNPHSSVNADLLVQMRVNDQSTWAPIPCSDGGTCGYRPMEWNLSASYYYQGDVRKPWLISNLAGEVGVRTLGLSYVSARYEGTGMLFALANREFYNRYFASFQQEDVFMLDSRAMQLPEHLAEAWSDLHEAQ